MLNIAPQSNSFAYAYNVWRKTKQIFGHSSKWSNTWRFIFRNKL